MPMTPGTGSAGFSACFLSCGLPAESCLRYSSSFFWSTRAKSAPHSPTARPDAQKRNASSVSVVSSSGVKPNRAAILAALSGAIGVKSAQPMRTASARLAITDARRARSASDLASTQGVVSSMYLLQWRNSEITSAQASASAVSPAAGTTPPKYWRIIAAVRETRLPRMLARSVLVRAATASKLMLPSFCSESSLSR